MALIKISATSSTRVKLPYKKDQTQWHKTRLNGTRPDSMAQWQDCQPECWEAWGPEFNPRPGRVGVRFLFLYKLGQPLKTFISYSLLSVAQIGRDYFEEFYIHFISSFMLSVLSAYTKKSSPSYMSEPPLKKGRQTL